MLCLFVSVFSLCLPCPALCFDLSVFLLLVFTPFLFHARLNIILTIYIDARVQLTSLFVTVCLFAC